MLIHSDYTLFFLKIGSPSQKKPSNCEHFVTIAILKQPN